MQYRITRVSHGHTMECITRKQFPAARLSFDWLVHDMVQANALLDRPIGHRLVNTARRISRDVHSAVIALDDAQSVTFERIGG